MRLALSMESSTHTQQNATLTVASSVSQAFSHTGSLGSFMASVEKIIS